MTSTALEGRLTRRDWALLFVLCGAVFLEGIDVSMMGVALPSIRAELGMSTTELQWVVGAYVLGFGGFVLLGGRAADLLGRRRMFLTWLVVFIAFSGLGGLATEGWMLILARFVTGLAAAFLAPAGLSIITTSFAEGRRRNQALLVYAGAGAGGFSLGMVAGGLLTAVDWRWVFFAPVVMASVILIAAVRTVPREHQPGAEDTVLPVPGIGKVSRGWRGFDLPGAVSLTGGMVLLVLTVVRAPDVATASTLLTLLASVVLLTAFAAIERRSPAPLVRLGILRNPSLVRANLGAVMLIASFVGFQFVTVLYLQEDRGWSETETGLALMVMGIDTILAPTLTPKLVNRFGNPPVILVGFALGATAYGVFLGVDANWSFPAMLPSFLLIGLMFALVYGPLTIAATDGVVDDEQGLASGVLVTSFQFGAALGLAVAAAVLAAGGFRVALGVPLAIALLGVLVTGLPRRARARR